MVNTSMKISIVLALVLTALVSVTVFGAGEKPRKPTNWRPIIGASFPDAKAFIDANSTEKNLAESGDRMMYTEILISYDKPNTTLVGKQKVVFQGMVRHIVVDCESGLSAPIYDFYFAEPKPTRTNKPVGALEYNAPIKQIATLMPKSSAIYQAVCPNYI